MRFTCEQCGKRYTTSDVLQPGRTYRTKCKACGNIIVVKGTADGATAPTSAPTPTPAPATIPPAVRPAAPLNSPSAPAIVPPAAAAPPSPPSAAAEPKYIDLFEGESLDDLAPSPAPPAAQARRKGTLPPPTPEPATTRASTSGSASPLGQLFNSLPETTPVNTALKQTRPPAYFGDIQPATPEPPPPQEPPKVREAPRDVPPPPRRGMPVALVAIAAGLIVAVLVGVVWRPWSKPGDAKPVAEGLPPPTTPVAPPPEPTPAEPTQPAQVLPTEPTQPQVAEPVQPQQSPEELARLEKERERQEKLAKAEQERQARLEKLEREKADKAAKAEQERLARLEKLEREKAEKAAKAEEARLAKLEKLEREKAEKAAKAEEARLAKLEKAEREKAAKAEQERLAKLEKEKADRERAEREKAAKAEQERLAKLPVGLGPEVLQTALASAKKSFDECVKNPSRGLDKPLEARQLRLRFMVQPQGSVSNPTVDDPVASSAPVGQCLKAAATALKFPEFRGDAVQVDTPIALPAPPPAATPAVASATGPVNVVVFTGPKSTRAGSAVGDTVYSERTEDAAITDHQFENGVVTYSGQVGFGKGSTWAGIGLNVDILPEGKPIDATRFKSVTFRLASPTTRSLRLRLIGNEPAVNQKGCYPTTLIRVSKEMKDYTFNFKDFDPETWCGSSGRTAAKTIPALIGFEIADINISGKPTSFSVGTITLNP
ncbi:MAG TPA: hypothetical protein VEB43_02900 [Anaeromyxobacter sp.]|nr:hypothetical protein [Anaeromyxobacter sp.]